MFTVLTGCQMTSSAQKIIIGVVALVLLGLFVLGVLMGAAVYGWKAALKAGDEAATIQNMKRIAAVEIQYYNTHSRTFGTFDQLVKEQLVTSKFSGDSTNTDGYVLTLKVTPRTSNQRAKVVIGEWFSELEHRQKPLLSRLNHRVDSCQYRSNCRCH